MKKFRSNSHASVARHLLYVAALALQVAFFASVGQAQPCEGHVQTQTFRLLPGWNSIFLHVDPSPNDPATVFQGVPALSVWTRKAGISSVEFIENSNELKFNQPGWLTFVPPSRDAAFASTLFRIRGNRAYLVHMPEDAAPTTLTVSGAVVPPEFRWGANAYTLTGLPVDAGIAPTFAAFFVASTAHKNQPIYRLLPTGVWERIAAPGSTQIKADEAYWIFTSGGSDYVGPIRVELPSPDGFDYGRGVTEERLGLTNLMSANTSILLRAVGTGGGAPLSYFKLEQPSQRLLWAPLGDSATFPVNAGKQAAVRLAIRRGEMPADRYCTVLEISNGLGGVRWMVPVEAQAGSAGSALTARGKRDTTDARFTGLWVGQVTVNAVSQPQSGLRCASSGDHPFAPCLTDGDCGTSKPCGNSSERRRCIAQSEHPSMPCDVDKDCGTPRPCDPEIDATAEGCGPLCVPVRRCADGGDHRLAVCETDADCGTSRPCTLYKEAPRFQPVPTQQETAGSTFTFRLIVHVDRSGQARLLKDVIQMYERGTTRPDPEHPGFETLDVPGHYVLVTDDTQLSKFSGSTLRDGRLSGRRISSIAFDFPSGSQTDVPNTLAMSGSFGAEEGAGACGADCPECALCATIDLTPDFALNPFRHKYHPDHDNQSPFGQPLPTPRVEAFPAPFPTPSGNEEVPAIRRRIGLQFLPCESMENKACGNGTMVEGVYRETISGVHQADIVTQGTFELERLDETAELNR